jgi:hypothetical protein
MNIHWLANGVTNSTNTYFTSLNNQFADVARNYQWFKPVGLAIKYIPKVWSPDDTTDINPNQFEFGTVAS